MLCSPPDRAAACAPSTTLHHNQLPCVPPPVFSPSTVQLPVSRPPPCVTNSSPVLPPLCAPPLTVQLPVPPSTTLRHNQLPCVPPPVCSPLSVQLPVPPSAAPRHCPGALEAQQRCQVEEVMKQSSQVLTR